MKMRLETALIAGLVVALLALGLQTWRLQRSLYAAQVAEANYAAAMDSTQTVVEDERRASTRLLEQKDTDIRSLTAAHQQAVRDRNAALRSLSQLRVRFDSVVQLAQAPASDTVFISETGDTTRVYRFPLAGPPIEGENTVRLGPTRVPTLDSRLFVSPFSISYGIGCKDRNAVLSWDTPDWVTADFRAGRIDPSVCNPPPAPLFRLDVGTGIVAGVSSLTTILLMQLLGG